MRVWGVLITIGIAVLMTGIRAPGGLNTRG
jgi:hypothetical protein